MLFMMTSRTILFAAVLSGTLLLQASHAARMANTSSEYKLRQELLTSYNHLVKPVVLPLTVVNVSILIKLIKIVDVDIKREVLTTKVLIEQKWHNPYLCWNESLFNGTNRVRMSNKEVWVPDITLQNSATNPTLDTQYLHEKWVTVYSNGTNVWVSLPILESECDFDITQFPFDEQKSCYLGFASESYDMKSLDIHLKPGVPNKWEKRNDGHSYLKTASNGEWEAGFVEVSRHEKDSPCCASKVVYIKLGMNMTRIPTFYILYLLCPFLVLTLLVFFSFVIPPESGERLGFSSSLLLSLSVYLLLFSDLMPNNSRNLNIFGVIFVLIFLEAALIVVTTVLVLKAYHATTSKIPGVLRILCCSFALCSRFKTKKNDYPLREVKENEVTTTEEERALRPSRSQVVSDDILLANTDQTTSSENKLDQEPTASQLTWVQIARSLDRLFFWLFLVTFSVTVAVVVMLGSSLGKVKIDGSPKLPGTSS